MDNLMHESVIWPRGTYSRDTATNLLALPLDLYETADDLVVTAAVPGAKADEVNVQVHEGRLILDVPISKPALEKVTYHYREIPSGNYHREITLPADIQTDKIEAVLENGYLTLRLPKAEASKPRRIEVTAK